jgi:multiple RNA-binding domain-containing protein 1
LALGETQIVLEMKKFLEDNDVQLDAFELSNKKRSKTVILVKNLPADTKVEEIQEIFEKFGILGRVLLPPSGVTALVEFMAPSEARKAFKKLAYTKFKHVPLYLEWAPEDTFKKSGEKFEGTEKAEEFPKTEETQENPEKEPVVQEEKAPDFIPLENPAEPIQEAEEEDDEPPELETTLFIKNLNFQSEEEAVKQHFKHLGPIHIVQVARKKDPANPRKQVSLGYGFIQFKKSKAAEKALKTMQFTEIEGKKIELKRSDRTLQADPKTARKQTKKKDQKNSTKIMVRNIPFQANLKEVREIFKVFGEIKALRLPKKMVPGAEEHRGFGFVDFCNKSDAKNAFEALHYSTHLYGRRLVLEWADTDEDVESLRKRTAEQFLGSEAKKSRKGVFKTDNIKINDDEVE